jgi:enoyl-[acyl-carrier-protein] reductase (NADH)
LGVAKVFREGVPVRRLSTIEDVGTATAFLASDLVRNITGGVLHIGAGRHLES